MTGNDEVIYRLTRIEQDIAAITARREKDVEVTAATFAQLREILDETEKARMAQERKLFITGIVFLGSVVSTLTWIIWNNLLAVIPGRH